MLYIESQIEKGSANVQNYGLRFIKKSKQKNLLHLAILLVLLAAGVGGSVLFKPAGVCSALLPQAPVGAIIITVGGSINNPHFTEGKNSSLDTTVSSLFGMSDLRIISLTAPVDDTHGQQAITASVIHSLFKESGINLVQLSDHRILSHGAAGLINTIDFLDMNQIAQVGAGFNREEAQAAAFYSKDNKTVAVLALNANAPPGWSAGKNRLGVASFDEGFIETLAEAKSGSDAVIALVSFTNCSSPQEQMVLARSLIDEGINLVIGTGTGPLRKVEHYRDGIIFPNIGNLSSPPSMFSYEKESVLLNIIISPEGKVEIRAIPLIVNHSKASLASGTFFSRKISARLGNSVWSLDIN